MKGLDLHVPFSRVNKLQSRPVPNEGVTVFKAPHYKKMSSLPLCGTQDRWLWSRKFKVIGRSGALVGVGHGTYFLLCWLGTTKVAFLSKDTKQGPQASSNSAALVLAAAACSIRTHENLRMELQKDRQDSNLRSSLQTFGTQAMASFPSDACSSFFPEASGGSPEGAEAAVALPQAELTQRSLPLGGLSCRGTRGITILDGARKQLCLSLPEGYGESLPGQGTTWGPARGRLSGRRDGGLQRGVGLARMGGSYGSKREPR